VEQELAILAINLGEASSAVKILMEDNGLTFPVLLDTDTSIAENYNIRGIPTTFFIDRNGIIKDKEIGPFSSKAEIDWRLINSIVEYESQGR
jgi:peroxiredoxin